MTLIFGVNTEDFRTYLEEDNKVEPLPKEITSEIRTILEECRDGKRLHRQQVYATQTSCGTAHCIAGWKVWDDLGYKVRYTPYDIGCTDLDMELTDDSAFDAWNYARDSWNLTEIESSALFDSDATFEQQFALLEMLESGKRLGTHEIKYN
jgi:hypothetical protein